MTVEYKDSKRISALSSDFPITTTTYDHIGDTNNAGLHAINTAGGHDGTKVGIKIIAGSSAIGTKIEYVSMSIRKWGSSTGNYQFQVIDGTDGTTVLASATSSASALTETPATVELQLDSIVTLSVNDRIVLAYPDGSGSNIVGLARNSATTESGYNRTILGYSTTTWSDTTVNNMIMTFDSSPATVSKPTNVQDNSILVEKDTGKRYWFDAPSIDTAGLKAYYKFDEASGNIVNQHTTGDGLTSADLTTTGVTYGVTGVISTAVSCDGSNDFMVSPSATKTDFNFIHALNQAWSINIWFKKANANDGGITALIANRVGSDVGIRIKNLDRSGSGETRKLQLEIDSGSAGSAVAMYDSNVDSFFPNDTDWHMLTITADNSITTNAMQIYLDGILNHNVNRVGVGDGGTPEYPMNFAQEGDGTDYGDYTFDETSFWTRKLSSTDVTTLYNSDSGFAITPATWTMEPTFEDDFSTYATQALADAVWATNDTTRMRVNISTDVFDFTSTRNGSAATSYHTLSKTASNDKWLLRFRYNMSSSNNNDARLFIGLSSTTGNYGSTEDWLGIIIPGGTGHNLWAITDYNNAATTIGSYSSFALNPVTGTNYYVELIRVSSTSFKLNLYSDSGYSTLINSVTHTMLATVDGLSHLKIMNMNNDSAGYSMTGIIDDVLFYNGVSSL